jgi:hypothetical protein
MSSKQRVIGHRAGSKRARAHQMIAKAGKLAQTDPSKVILAIKKTLKVKPATAASWFYDMRGAKSKEHKPQAAQ